MMSKSAIQHAQQLWDWCFGGRIGPNQPSVTAEAQSVGLDRWGHPKLSAKPDAVPRLICLTCVL